MSLTIASVFLVLLTVMAIGCVADNFDPAYFSASHKAGTFFQAQDVDGDGNLTKSDLKAVVKRLKTPTAPCRKRWQKKSVEKTFVTAWKLLVNYGNTNDTPVTIVSLVASFWAHINDTKFKEDVTNFVNALFYIINYCDKDRRSLTLTEFSNLFNDRDIDPNLIEAQFGMADSNQDGKLSLDEFNSCGEDFFLGIDLKAGICPLLYGPIERDYPPIF